MKKILLSILLLLCSSTTFAQWSFTVDYTSNCGGFNFEVLEGEHIKAEYNNRQYPTKSACEAARNSIRSPYSCLIIHCGPCTGQDAGGEDVTVSSEPNIFQQGTAITPHNRANEVSTWEDDYLKKIAAYNDRMGDYHEKIQTIVDELISRTDEYDDIFHTQIDNYDLADRRMMSGEFIQVDANGQLNFIGFDYPHDFPSEKGNIETILPKEPRVEPQRRQYMSPKNAKKSVIGQELDEQSGFWNDAATATKDGFDGLKNAGLQAGGLLGPIGTLATTTIGTVDLGKSLSGELEELFKDVRWALLSSDDIIELNKKIDKIYEKHMGIMLSRLPGGTVLRLMWNHRDKLK